MTSSSSSSSSSSSLRRRPPPPPPPLVLAASTGLTLVLLLLGTHVADGAPTHTTTSAPSPPTPLVITTTSTTSTHRPTSHPIWHLLLALWRPKDTSHEDPSEGGHNGVLTLPSAARLVQDDGGGGGGSASSSPTAADQPKTVADLGSHIDASTSSVSTSSSSTSTAFEGTATSTDVSSSSSTSSSSSSSTAKEDEDTPQHPHSGSSSSSSSSSSSLQLKTKDRKQHSDSTASESNTDASNTARDDMQHKDVGTQTPDLAVLKMNPQHTGRDPEQQRKEETPEGPVSDAPQHSEQHTGMETAQHPDTDTPQHPARNTKPKSVSTASPNTRNTPKPADATQERDPDTPQHPARNTPPKPSPNTPLHPTSATQGNSNLTQHSDLATQQEPDRDTPQHPARNTPPKPTTNTPLHPTSATQKQGNSSLTQHTDSETQQEPDRDTPQHPARNTQPKPSRQHHQQPLNTSQHQSANTTKSTPEQHPDSDTPKHPTSNTQPKGSRNTSQHATPGAEETRDRDTPQHPARNTKKKEEDRPQQHPAPSSQPQQHSSPETHPDPSSEPQAVPSTRSNPVPSTQEHPDQSFETQKHSSTQSNPVPSSKAQPDTSFKPQKHSSTQLHPVPSTQGHPDPSFQPQEHPSPQSNPVSSFKTQSDPSSQEVPQPSSQLHTVPSPQANPDPSSQAVPHPRPQPHPVPNPKPDLVPFNPNPPIHPAPSPHPHPVLKISSHPDPSTDPHPIRPPIPSPRPRPHPLPLPLPFPRQSDQPYSPLSQLHPPHAQYHPTPHTAHHPVLHIQPHATSQPQLQHGTPWRMPHYEDPSPQAATDPRTKPIPPVNVPDDGILQETLAAPAGQDESSHPAVMGSHGEDPGSGQESSEEEEAAAEPKLDDHFFLHPMPHHRDVTLPDAEGGQADHHHHHRLYDAAPDQDTGSGTTDQDAGSPEAGRHLTTTPRSNSSEAERLEEQLQGVEDRSLHVEEEQEGGTEEGRTKEEDAPAAEGGRGAKVLQVQGPVVVEPLDEASLAPLVGQAREVLTLRDNETAVLALLRVTQTSGGSSDTFQANAMIQAEDAGDLGDDLYSGLSHRDDLRSLEAAAAGSGPAQLVQTESDGRAPMAVLAKKDAKTLEARKTINALDTAEKSHSEAAAAAAAADELTSTMKPIYEEISATLQVDTSIDDVEDFDVQTRHTETPDDFLPPANTSHTNLIDIALHPPPPGDPAAPAGTLMPPAGPSSPIDPQTPLTPAPQTFSNYPSHYPPKISPAHDADTAATTAAAGDGADGWAPFVGNFSELSNASLALNASLIQKSHVLSVEEHYRMVLQERGSLMLQLMDPTADPCEDFYQFACGRWNGKFPIRQDKAVDNTFERLKEDLDDVLRSLLEEEPLTTDNNITLTVKTLYGGCMNTEAIEALGADPLLSLLRELGGWPVLEGDAWNSSGYDWVRQMARLRNYNNDILISEWVAADITNSSNHIIQLDQPELGLPGREYFINPGDFQYREAYLDLMLNVTQLLGAALPRALKDMTEVLHFETHLSRILTPAEERRNLSAVHRRLTVDQLTEEVPEVDWALYLEAITWGNNHSDEVVVFGLDYFKKLVALLEFTDDRVVSNYLLWRFVKNRISNLGENYTKIKQDYIKVLFGRQSQPERWRSCVTYVSGNLGYVVGAMFVKRYFPEASKNDTDEMIGLIRESFGTALRGAHWMNEATRHVAQEKVNTIVKNVGYPDYLLNDTYMDQVYAELSFNRETHFENVLKMLQFHARTNHDLLSVPVNRTAWVTSPAVVNAYYSRSKNMIVFPAGILQPPFYHPAFPRSLNYGGIGVVIGHEITHGFDDRGRQFDKNGNLQQWWTPSDVSQFYQRASCMLDQYGEYQVDEVDLKINPVNTLGENIADNAGIKISYQAYQNWRQNNEESVTLPYVNLTHDQLFFLNFGQIWCEINSPEAMLTKIRSGQHSPNKFRVIGTLSNSEEFSEAFNCPLGSAMNPEKKCRVW